MNFHHAERGSGVVGHGVHREVVGRAVGHERANAQCLVVHQCRGSYGGFVTEDESRGGRAGLRLVRFFDQRCASNSRGADCVRHALRQVGEAARLENVLFAACLKFDLPVEDIEKSLSRGRWQRAAGNKLDGHLREARAQLRSGVNDELYAIGAGQGRADKCIWRLQQVIRLPAAAG